jgi:hypothetical protein
MNGTTNGFVIGRGKRNYTLWAFRVDGWKIYYTHLGALKAAALTQHEDTLIVDGLSANWHTQAELTSKIHSIIRQLRTEQAAASQVIPFGKFKGTRVNEVQDLSYLCWLANQDTKDNCYNGIDTWLKESATRIAEERGAIRIGQALVDPNDNKNRLVVNSLNIYRAIQANAPIEYIAEQNSGNLWSLYTIGLPTISIGHSYYGVCECLDVDGKARKVKGFQIHIYDYTVEDTRIKVNGFYVTRN